MLRVLSWIAVAALVVVIAWWIAALPGELTLHAGHVTATAPSSVAIVLLAVLFLLLYLALRLLTGLLRLPRTLRWGQAARRRAQGEIAITRALTALAAREPGDARREAARARRLIGETPQTLLLAAYAARIAGRDAEAEDAFRRLAGRSDGAFLGLRGLLRQALDRRDWGQAADLAKRAEAARPGAASLRSERLEIAIRTGAWTEALGLAGSDAPRAALATAAAEAASGSKDARRFAKLALDADPAFAPAALAYARRLRAAGRESAAQAVLRRCWGGAPNPDLAEFALAPITDPLARVRAGQDFVADAPTHPESHLLLARLSLAAGLIGEARRHAAAAAAQGLKQRRLYLLLADIAEADPVDTGAALPELLRSAARADPDPVWHCTACSATYPSWRPICETCGTPGQVLWSPPRGSRPPPPAAIEPMGGAASLLPSSDGAAATP